VTPRPIITTVAKADSPPVAVVITANSTGTTPPTPAVSSLNFSGLELVDGDRIGLAMGGDFSAPYSVLHATFDTDLATTVANLAADMALEDVTFSNISVNNNIITFTGPTDGTAMVSVAVKVDHETLSDVGITQVGSNYLSNSMAAQNYSISNHILGIGESYDNEAQIIYNERIVETGKLGGGPVSTADDVSVEETDVLSSSGSMRAVRVLDDALAMISSERSNLGAFQNRLEHAVSNMSNTSQNTQSARSVIADADYAKEATDLAKNQILQQAGTAMLAQANSQAETVLNLLK